MTIYNLINWNLNGESITVIAEFRSSLVHAVRAARQMHSDSVSYYLHEIESKRRMYNAMLGYCNDERRIPAADTDRICMLVWKVYRRTMRQTYSVKTAV